MASHGSDTNKVHLLMSFPSFFFLCQAVCLYVKQMPFINVFFHFSFFSVCVPICLSVKQRSLINEFSFVFLSLSVCLGGEGYSHIRAVRVCAARKPRIFRPGPLLKTPLFRPGPHRKTPLFKNIHLFVLLFRHGLLQKIRLLKICVSLLFLFPKPLEFQ